MNRPTRFILGSRSPRRLELLATVVPRGLIDVLPPADSSEPGFENRHDWSAIEDQLRVITRQKCDAVFEQWQNRTSGPTFAPDTAIISADTVVVVRDKTDRLIVLGQPPENEQWQETVRQWFREFYAGRAHWVATALRVAHASGKSAERLVKSEVTFIADVESRLDWYLATDEPRGKAGGYALQGAGSVFIERVEGSLSNVVGLPLEALLDAFDELRVVRN
jgi:septum formation protein